MKIILDLEANGLNPTKIWVVVAKDFLGNYHIFRRVTDEPAEAKRLLEFLDGCTVIIGHNILGYDLPVMCRLVGASKEACYPKALDTFIISKLVDYPRDRHSIEDYGEEFNLLKGDFSDWSQYSQEMEDYCIRDVDITEKVYLKYKKYIDNPDHKRSIDLLHKFQPIVSDIEDRGFMLDTKKVSSLLEKVTVELSSLDTDILNAFQPRLKPIREILPKATKYGTISLANIPKSLRNSISEFTVDAPFTYCSWVEFNPASHKQILQVLNEAKWSPVDKTKTHIEAEREYNKLSRSRKKTSEVALKDISDKLLKLKEYGWKVNENNLSTLPPSAPLPARLLSKRILYEARRRTLVEWQSLVRFQIEVEKTYFGKTGIEVNGILIPSGAKDKEVRTNAGAQTISKNPEHLIVDPISNTLMDYRSKRLLEWLRSKKVAAQFVSENANSTLITVTGQEQYENCCAALATVTLDGLRNIHPKFKTISHRIHGKFTAQGAWTGRMSHQNPNMANIANEFDTNGKTKLLGKELRQCWTVPKNRLLVGVDAEGIQLRIFAHYINDPEFTDALVRGKKEDKSDPHSLNQRVLGSVCKSRAAAKRYIYALLLGAGLGKLREILDCSESTGNEAYERLLQRYPGFAKLKSEVIPLDAKRGWFTGLDGRRVRIPGDTEGERRHLAMSGYLQNGEAVVIETAVVNSNPKINELDSFFVNIIHDETQIETPNDFTTALRCAEIVADNIRLAGVSLNLKCPLAGSYMNDHGEYSIGRNWYQTH